MSWTNTQASDAFHNDFVIRMADQYEIVTPTDGEARAGDVTLFLSNGAEVTGRIAEPPTEFKIVVEESGTPSRTVTVSVGHVVAWSVGPRT